MVMVRRSVSLLLVAFVSAFAFASATVCTMPDEAAAHSEHAAHAPAAASALPDCHAAAAEQPQPAEVPAGDPCANHGDSCMVHLEAEAGVPGVPVDVPATPAASFVVTLAEPTLLPAAIRAIADVPLFEPPPSSIAILRI